MTFTLIVYIELLLLPRHYFHVKKNKIIGLFVTP